MKPIFIIDGLHLSYGIFYRVIVTFDRKMRYGYNRFGDKFVYEEIEPIYANKLGYGDGITTFKNETDLNTFLDKFKDKHVFKAIDIHRVVNV